MKVLVIGANGQLGTDLCQALRDSPVVPLTHRDIEISDMPSAQAILNKHKPDVIINTAAYIRVDDCEVDIDKAFTVNVLVARNVAVIAQELGAKLVPVSTDYIFGGEDEPHSVPYTEFDTPMPLNIYGKSKLAGENFVQHLCPRHFIVRTSGLFGIAGASDKGGNFVERILQLAREQEELRVVNDQIFCPTYTKDLAKKIIQLMTTEYYGLFHITNKGACSWYQFANQILRLAGLQTPVIPITSEECP